MRLSKEYAEKSFNDAFILRETIPFRHILPGRMFQLIQPWPVQQIVSPKSVVYGSEIVFFSQPIKTNRSATISCPDCCIPTVWIRAEDVSLSVQRSVKILGGAGVLAGLVDGLPHPGIPRGFFGFGLLNDRQAVLPAQLVRCRPELGILTAALLVLFAIYIGHGIDNEVVVQIIRVHVGGNQHLETLAPNPAGQRHANLMALLWSDLTLAEALVGVERYHSVRLTKAFLYRPHIFPRVIHTEMDAGDKLGAFVQRGFGIIFRVVESLSKGIVFGFVRVGRII